jgi:lipoate---protein ligase
MTKVFRVIDTGVRNGRRHIAFDQAMIEARKTGCIPDTIRFLRFPATALIGRHQALSQSVKLDYCRSHGIGVARRITGGGAIYLDEGQLGWELVFNRATLGITSLDDLAREICEAAAAGLSRLGVPAKYRPRNDIEVDGRKISGTGGFFDEDTIFFQGTVLVDMNPADMVAALNVAQPKLAKRSLDSAAQRVVTLKELLGTAPEVQAIQDALLAGFAERLAIEAVRGASTADEEALAAKLHDEEIGTDEFVAQIEEPGVDSAVRCGTHTGQGGTVTAYVRLEGTGHGRIRDALLTGDFFITPPRAVLDLEASLRNLPAGEAGAAAESFLAQAQVNMLSVSPADFRSAVEAAVGVAR